MEKIKSVLITGGNGFLGKSLISRFSKSGVKIYAPSSQEVDLCNDADLNSINVYGPFDHIFHLAAWTQAGTFCDQYRGDQWIINQKINTNILNWWLKNSPNSKMITLGTSVSYSDDMPLSEEFYMQGLPNDKFYAYAMSKRMLYAGLQCLNRQYGMQYLYLIPSTLYGPNYHIDNRQPHFIYDLIRKILRGKIHGEKVVLWGDGNQRRELVFVEDFISTTLKLNQDCSNDIFNIGGGHDYSIRDFALRICELVDFDFSRIEFDESQYVGAKSKILDISKYQNILGNDSLVSVGLDIGLQLTIDWFYLEYNRFLK
jgi:GDP-L-fucose synthase